MLKELIDGVKVTFRGNVVKVLIWIQKQKDKLRLRRRKDDVGQFINCHKWC